MRINKTKIHHNIYSFNKAKIFKLFRVSFFSFCLVATLVSITQVFSRSSSVFAEGNNNSNNTVSASSSATASVTVSSACSFSRTNEGDGSYTGTLANNSDTEITGSTFKTICNDPGGYAIYAIGYSNNTLGNTDLIFNDTPESTNNIKTNGDTLVGGNGSYWKMKLSPVSGDFAPTIENSYSSYSVVPSNYTKVASFNNVTVNSSDSTTGSSVTASYLAYASSTQPAGTYTGAVKYTMVHPDIITGDPYIIIFNSNGGTGDMNAQAILPNAPTPLSPNEFIAPVNQAFGGWCTTSTTNCTDGTLYTNEQAVTNLTTAGGEITLYAMWGKTITTMTYLQDFASPVDKNSIASTMTEDTAYSKTDQRDNKSYYISKLKDGHIWMTQNLDLDITSDPTSPSYIALTSNNTDLSTDESIYIDPNTIYALKGAGDTYGYTYENGIATWIPERDTIAYNQLSSTTWINDVNHPYSYDRLNTSTGAPVYPDGNVTEALAGDHGLSGNYYNWTAALASNDSTKATGDPVNSICPKGWRLPNVTNKEFGNLLVAYGIIETNTSVTYLDGGSAKMSTTPLYFVRGGFLTGGSIIHSNSGGFYWSSTFGDSFRAYSIRNYSNQINPQYYDYRYFGWFVRCIVK